MASTSPAAPETPDTGDGNTPQGRSATGKDKQCPYCGQAFTSSSLGRHLDQYISKKKADGIHHVEEIKKLRGTITRRQARNSSVKQDKDEVDSNSSINPTQRKARSYSPVTIPFVDQSGTGMRISLNAANWQATGVINDIPKSGTSRDLNLAPVSLKRSATVLEPPARPEAPDRDTVRALELALREVLDNVQAASARSGRPTSPFDFDFQAQSYPSLCLLLLPPTPLLFSSMPFSTQGAAPIEPPGQQQLEPLRSKIQALIDQWRAGSLPGDAQPRQTPSDYPSTILNVTRQHSDMARQHLELAYQHWADQRQEAKQDQWRLEIMRAYKREMDRRKALEEQLHRVEQEARRLQSQVDMLSRCQWPREFALFPPDSRPLSTQVSQELQRGPGFAHDGHGSSDDFQWTYENVLTKWKRVVAEDSARRLGMAASSSKLSPISDNVSYPPTATVELSRSASQPTAQPSGQVDLHPIAKRARLANGNGGAGPAREENGNNHFQRPMSSGRTTGSNARHQHGGESAASRVG